MKSFRPEVTRDGRVLIPSVWSLLAERVLNSRSPVNQREAALMLAEQVLAAAESEEPARDALEGERNREFARARLAESHGCQ
jgi:hypothetical protein